MSDIYKYLEDIVPENTAHGSGEKSVFLESKEIPSALTQIAYGKFKPGESCEPHVHPTMEECFFFIKGSGIYKVGDQTIRLRENTFLRIPAGVQHQLIAEGSQLLEFVYWGVALNKRK